MKDAFGRESWGAVLYLESGGLFRGLGFGSRKESGGEVVFNTGMTGYQEILTDPSYKEQIVVMTLPHIGNTGVNPQDLESLSVHARGLVVREYNEIPSSWRATNSLDQFLKDADVPGIYDVDTRAITRSLREGGSQRAILFPTASAGGKDLQQHGKNLLLDIPKMEGQELVSRVSCSEPFEFNEETGSKEAPSVVVYDYGAKWNILRLWKNRGFRVHVVPYHYPHQEVLKLKPSAVCLSNGPGDPAFVPKAPEEISSLIGKVPILAICMGHQLLARALGFETYKLKFGHHGVNHPVRDLLTGRILITSQNHGFAVKIGGLPQGGGVQVSHVSLNDDTVEGFVSEEAKLYSLQFHPESKPGPNDADSLFDYFIRGFLR